MFKAGPALNSPAAVRDYLRLKLVAEPNEIFAVVFLDNQHQVIAFEPLFRARSTRLRYPRVVVQRALALNARRSSWRISILRHTVPSAADRRDRPAKSALATVDVRVLDHFIVGRARRTPSPNPACCSGADRPVPAGASAPAFSPVCPKRTRGFLVAGGLPSAFD